MFVNFTFHNNNLFSQHLQMTLHY